MNLSFGKKCVYALGQFGLVLCAYGAGKLFVSFFVTRGISGSTVFPLFWNQGYYFGLFTIAGLIIALNRLVDITAGILSGWFSDRNRMKKGRRTGFMLVSAVPLSLFSVLVFFPPVQAASSLNAVFVLVCTVCFFAFLSLYTTPYLALLSEFGSTPRERIHLSMLMAFAAALAYLIGNQISGFMDQLGSTFGFSAFGSFRLIICLYGLVSCVCLVVPPLLIRERKYSQTEPVTDSFSVAFSTVLKDSYFRSFLGADIMYRLAAAVMISGLSLYVTMLLGLPTASLSLFLLLIFLANIVLYFPVSLIVIRVGKRRVLFAAFLMLMLFLVIAAFAGDYPFDPFVQGVFLSLMAAIPLTIFSVVPNALVADLAVASERKTGIQRGGMYFGVHSLVVKAGELFSALFFPYVISIGAESVGAPGRAGLRLTLIIAAFFSLVGFFFLFGYREKEISSLFDRQD